MTEYKIALPEIPSEVYQFSVTVSLPTASFQCTFKWLNDIWNVFVTFPDGSVREALVLPDVLAWDSFPDYKLAFTTDLSYIPRLSLGKVNMFILDIEG